MRTKNDQVCRKLNDDTVVVPSIYSSARTELAKLLIYGLFRKIRVLAQDGRLIKFGAPG